MKKLKVMVVVGTRPEIIRLSRVIADLDKHADLLLVHTGQNYDYELNEIFFKELGIRDPDIFLEAVGNTAAETVGNIIAKCDSLLTRTKPDALLVLGDTNSCLAVFAAKKQQIPIFHMEAGNRCFDQRVPEESNRKVVDHLADINMPYSDIARDYLLREGLPPDRIVKTGSPMYEVLHHYLPLIDASDVLERHELEKGGYFVVSCHREENVESERTIAQLGEILNGLAEQFAQPVIVSTHPRTRKQLEAVGLMLDPLIRLLKPLGLPDYVQLQRSAHAVLSDSGTITEESNILNFPALNIREAHERPEGMEEGAVVMTGLSLERVLQGVQMLDSRDADSRISHLVKDYEVDNVSQKVTRIIYSYTDYVNRTVWKK